MTEDHAVEHMTGFEALMWDLERNPLMSTAFTNLTILDRVPNRAALRSRMLRATRRVPKLRQRADPSPGPLGTPAWIEDPEFDLDHHLRWVNLGGSATREDLNEFVAGFSVHPFDWGRPLWDFVLIEGLADGRAAMAQRMHHTITDGEGGIKLSVEFLDLRRDAGEQPVEADTDDESGQPSSADPQSAGDAAENPTDGPRGWTEWTGVVGDSMKKTTEQVTSAWSGFADSMRNPSSTADSLRSTVKQIPTTRRVSDLWSERSLRRWFGCIHLELDQVITAAHALGGSVNDFFVTGAAGGAGAYHRNHDSPVDELRLSMPVSTREHSEMSDTAGGNSFTPTTTMVATGQMDPAERFASIHDALNEVKAGSTGSSIDSAVGVMNLLPSAAIAAAGERIAGAVDFVCSNVRAAPFDLYIGGALIEANYPLGPLAGTAFNLTTMSYRGRLFIGLVVDTAAVSGPEELLAEIDREYEALFAAAG